jgi:hypothetical protein
MFEKYYTLTDLVLAFGLLVIFCFTAHVIRTKNRDKEEYRYYLPHFYWKLLLCISFTLTYTLYYNGGDTTAYHDGAMTLRNLFFESPLDYFHEIVTKPERDNIPHYFNNITGRPPEWIYPEANSWVVCKIASFFEFFSFGSYLVMNLYFAMISTWVSWRFYRFMLAVSNIKPSYLAIACLFIPSVGFWCTGLMKDTIVMCAILISVMSFFKLLIRHYRNFYSVLLVFIIANYFLFVTRPFVLICVFVPYFIIIVLRLNKDKPALIRGLTRLSGVLIAVTALAIYLRSSSFGEYSSTQILETAEVINKDFQVNERYTGKRYSIGVTEFGGSGLIKAIPGSIIASLYRPFIWEFEGALMLIIGFEGLFFLFFTGRYLVLSFLQRRRFGRRGRLNSEIIIFAVLFTLILGYFVGFTSGLFGVLVRLKAPILPFFTFVLISLDKKEEEPIETIEQLD